ncbi:MAG: hypothetical protein Q8N18_22490 [Opitutaceae bacterium]|nr:hypothetical protein [Opitutaceae bacterium]
MKRPLLPALAITLGVAALLAADAQPRVVSITLPTETARLADSPLPGAALATALCSTCHSSDYVLTQPPASSRAYWKNTVIKMQKTFGAPIPDTAIDPLTDYLVKLYGAERAAAK